MAEHRTGIKAQVHYIALFGYNGAGKSTVADYIQNRLKYPSVQQICGIHSFADILREAAARLFTMPYKELSKHEFKDEKYPFGDWLPFTTPREALISLGEGLKKVYGEDFWARVTMERIKDLSTYWVERMKYDYYAIIDDLRFISELDLLQKQGSFTAIKVERTDKECTEGYSEVMKYFDEKGSGYETIQNNGSLLYTPVKELLTKVYKLPSY